MISRNALTTALATITVLAVIGGGYFLVQSQLLSRNLKTLEAEKARLTSELTVLKATDQVLRAELLQEKLSTAERGLAAARQDAAQLRNRNTTLEEHARKLTPYVRAVKAIQQSAFSEGSFREIQEAIAALGDPDLVTLWQNTERIVREDLADGSWSPQPIDDMVVLLLGRIEQLLSAP